ncbi:hypothetical protein SODALDRAFT_84953 [Sodiomyces alkalinus F11]|uniref:Uncharacterized protein n=1 Tax=Sodiomyces alkalinus (strain CBS 110278 / VKM F-3762 / F11) TaxID=1314773 RepID=A0A3N2PJS4_SODAK|nr:hypothetical protein SODALDRAFT_84953 [Sodiomyces alkalinus F11]ROT34775.1 hypothetical protein SODALDRAFT_84953 [Sodiomyces alkalinus F11]
MRNWMISPGLMREPNNQNSWGGAALQISRGSARRGVSERWVKADISLEHQYAVLAKSIKNQVESWVRQQARVGEAKKKRTCNGPAYGDGPSSFPSGPASGYCSDKKVSMHLTEVRDKLCHAARDGRRGKKRRGEAGREGAYASSGELCMSGFLSLCLPCIPKVQRSKGPRPSAMLTCLSL